MVVKDDYSLSTSSDGEKWSTVYAASDFSVSAAAWNGKVLVAVGYGGRILTTSDFKTWSKFQLDSLPTLQSIAWTGKVFVATGNFGALLTSTDGVIWTPQNSGTDQNLNGVAANDSMIVAVGGNGDISFSRTGFEWAVSKTGVENVFLEALWDGKQFIASGDTVLVSVDGMRWEGRGRVANDRIRLEVKAADTYFATGKTLYASKDLSTWAPVENLGNTQALWAMAWNGSRLVAAGSMGEIFLSDNGRDWRGIQTGVRQDLLSIAKSESVYVAVGMNSILLRSRDGVKWDSIPVDLPSIPPLLDVGWTGNRFVAVGFPGIILSSPDGITWIQEKAQSNKKEFDLVFSWNGNTLILGEDGLVLHPDGAGSWTQTWLKEDLGVDFYPQTAVFAQGEIFVGGSYGQIFSSTDGYHWQYRRAYNLSRGSVGSLAWNGQEFLGLGLEFLQSADGITWNSENQPEFTKGLSRISWTGREFVALGGSIIRRSTDGVQWTQVTWEGKERFGDILVDGNRFFLVGEHGLILEMENDLPVSLLESHRHVDPRTSPFLANRPIKAMPLLLRAGETFRPDGKKLKARIESQMQKR